MIIFLTVKESPGGAVLTRKSEGQVIRENTHDPCQMIEAQKTHENTRFSTIFLTLKESPGGAVVAQESEGQVTRKITRFSAPPSKNMPKSAIF